MKKYIAVAAVGTMLLLLTSCRVHLGDVTLQLPWWVVTVVSVIPACLIVGIVAWGTAGDNAKAFYVCPHCEHRFKPGWKLVISPHVNDDYVLTCPHCGKRDVCSLSHNQEE